MRVLQEHDFNNTLGSILLYLQKIFSLLCRWTVDAALYTYGFNILICSLEDWILYRSKLDLISFWTLTSIIHVTLDSRQGKLFS